MRRTVGPITKPNRSARKQPPAPVPAPRGSWWRIAVILLAGVLTYANSLSGPFILDDQSTIADNQQIREWWRPSIVLAPEPNTAIAGRPVVNVTFAANYATGGLDVRGYHVVNISLHLLCGLLAFGIIRRTLDLPRLRKRFDGRAVDIAFAAALLWVVHPLNSEVVNYLTERTESLMALFYLLTLYASIRGWPALAVMSCALGMATKESMVTAPLMVVLYDRVFVYDSFGQALRARRGFYAALASTWVVLGALMASGPRSAVGGFSTGVSPWTYLLNQAVTIAHYLRLSFWPRSLVVFYGWPVPLTLWDVLPYALLIVGLIAATILALARAPTLGFLGAWFFITLAPTSSIVPISTEVGAERRMYLPLLAVVALAVVGSCAVWRRFPGRRSSHDGSAPRVPRGGALAAAIVLAMLGGSLALATIARNREYRSPLTLARTVVERRPTAVSHHYLAEQLVAAGLRDEAMPHLRAAVAGGDSRARYLLGFELFNAGKLPEAMEQLYAFVATSGLPYRLVPHWLEPPFAEVITARLVLAKAASMQGGWSRAAEQARLVLKGVPGNREARMFLADALFALQRYDEAAAEYTEYRKSKPDDVHALNNLGIALISGGKLDEAILLFRRAVEVEPRNPNARRILGMALFDRGDFEGAAAQAREGVALSPKDPAMRDLLARASSARPVR